MMPITNDQCLALVTQWKKEGVSASEIQERLEQQNVPSSMADEVLLEWKKLNYARKRGIGLFCCGTGALLLFTSFLITLILFNTEHNFSLYLYGLTFIGISILFKGMVDLLGW